MQSIDLTFLYLGFKFNRNKNGLKCKAVHAIDFIKLTLCVFLINKLFIKIT